MFDVCVAKGKQGVRRQHRFSQHYKIQVYQKYPAVKRIQSNLIFNKKMQHKQHKTYNVC